MRMRAKPFFAILPITLLLNFSIMSSAEKASENYRVKNSVKSGGGTIITSDNYQTNSTIGQPSSLLDSLEPLKSTITI